MGAIEVEIRGRAEKGEKENMVECKECSKTWRDKSSLLFPVDTFRSSANVPNSLCLR